MLGLAFPRSIMGKSTTSFALLILSRLLVSHTTDILKYTASIKQAIFSTV